MLEKFSVLKTLQAIDEANVAILVIDAQVGVAEQDASLAGYALEAGRALVVAVNKWDAVQPGERDWAKRELERKLPFLDFARMHFISARDGTGVGGLFRSVDEAHASAQRTLSTPKLNRVLLAAVTATPPPLLRGRRARPKYDPPASDYSREPGGFVVQTLSPLSRQDHSAGLPPDRYASTYRVPAGRKPLSAQENPQPTWKKTPKAAPPVKSA